MGMAASRIPWYRSRRFQENLSGWIWSSPFTIGFVVFIGGPMVASAFLAFTQWDIIRAPEWTGLANFQRLLFEDELVWISLRVTTVYSLMSVPLSIVLGLALAMLLNTGIRGLQYYRTIFYLPAVLSGVAVALLWRWLFTAEGGLLNIFLGYVGIQGPGWLTSEDWALPALVIMSLWHVGGTMVIYLAGLQGIPTDLYEAAHVDGANWWDRTRAITIPLMTPIIFYMFVMGLITALQTFTQAYIMTAGGPFNATLFFMLYLYRNAFEWFKMGYASALAWVLFAYILALTLVVFRFSRGRIYYEGDMRGR
ncbi:MAG: sugar ABC transporter permease [Chloroflexi bacterium]|nr:sugar ABC transporter permease [Chloroflexota bacterium]